MATEFGKGIVVASGFDLGAKAPLDSRIVVAKFEDIQAHIDGNRAYDGMMIYCEENQKNYQIKLENEKLVPKDMASDTDQSKEDIQGILDSIGTVGDGKTVVGMIGEEATARDTADQGLQAAINNLDLKVGEIPSTEGNPNHDSIVDMIQDLVAIEKGRAEGAETGLQNAITKEVTDRQAADQGLQAAINKLNGTADEEGSVAKAVADEAAARDTADQGLQAAINKLNGTADEEGSVAKAVADEAARIDAVVGDLAGTDIEVKDAEGNAVEDATIAQQLAQVKDELDAEAGRAAQAEQALHTVVGTVEGALPETGLEGETVAAQLTDAGTRVKALEDDLAAQKDATKDGLAKQIATEKARAEGAEKGLQDAIVDLADSVSTTVEDVIGDLSATGLQGTPAEGETEAPNKTVAQQLTQAHTDIVAEAGRADAAEKALAERLDVIEGEGEGSIKEAVAEEASRAAGEEARIVGLVEAEASRADTEEKRIVGLVEAEASRAAGEEARIEDLVEAEASRADGVEKGLQAAIDKLNGAATEEGSVAKAVKDAVDAEATARQQADNGLDQRLQKVEAAIGEDGALEARVAANEDAIEVINGTGEGSIKKAVADLVNGAPEALDTLDELAAALRDNKDVLTAIETAFDGKLAELQADVDQNEADCDAAIKSEKERAEGVEAAIRGEFAAADTALHTTISAEIDADVKVEKERAEGVEAAIRQEMAAEATRVNQKIADDIAAESALRVAEEARIEGKVNAEAQRADVEEKRIVGLVEAEKGRAEGKEGELLAAINKEIEDRGTAVNAEKERAEGQEAAIRQEMATAIGQHAAEGVEASGLRKEMDDAVKAESDRAKAAEKANADDIIALQNSVVETISELQARIDGETGELVLEVVNKEADGEEDTDGVVAEGVEISRVKVPVMTEDEVTALIADLGITTQE